MCYFQIFYLKKWFNTKLFPFKSLSHLIYDPKIFFTMRWKREIFSCEMTENKSWYHCLRKFTTQLRVTRRENENDDKSFFSKKYSTFHFTSLEWCWERWKINILHLPHGRLGKDEKTEKIVWEKRVDFMKFLQSSLKAIRRCLLA